MIIIVSRYQTVRLLAEAFLNLSYCLIRAGFTDLLAPRLRRSPSPESSANLLLDFSHLTDQMSFSNLMERANGSHTMSTFSNNIPTTRLHPAPPAPPPPPPLPVYNSQAPSVASYNGNNNMDAGPSNFNAAFDFGSTYAVASSNYDTPFLSASESNWLFNHADLQFDTQVPSSNNGNGRHPDMLTRLDPPPHPPPPPPPLPAFARHLQGQRSQVSHSRQNSLLQYPAKQNMPGPSTTNGSSGTRSPRNNTFPTLSNASTAFPSSLSSILNPSQRRNSRHVHFADANTQEARQQIENTESLHPPLPPPTTANGGTSQQSNGSQSSGQIPTPRTIKIGLATRNRLAKHLAVSRYHRPLHYGIGLPC